MKVTFDCAARSCDWFAPDTSLLDVAAASAIPTIAACGGNGICSTCRVEVLEGLEHLAPRSAAEEAQADKRGWPANVRLACAARVIGSGEVKVRRLITPPANASASDGRRDSRASGRSGLWRCCSPTCATSHRSPKAARRSM
jgi:ferredoxin